MRSTMPGQESQLSGGAHDSELTEAVNRVLASPVFERTHRLSELLTYVSLHTLAGDAQALKEGSIGRAIFGRPESYNAADDNIVRANVRQLRMKLDEYYQTCGVGDPWRVTVPKGSYALRLEPAVAPPVEVAAATLVEVPKRKFRALALASSLTLALLLGVLLWRQGRVLPPAHTLLSLLSPAPGQNLMIIGPDSGVQFYRQFTGHSVLLEQFLDRSFLSPENLRRVAPDLSENVISLFHGGYTESFLPGLMPAFAQVLPSESLTMPPPTSVKVRDFERDNAILISGPLGNPWVQLFDRSLNFQIEQEAENQRHSYIVNRKPQNGEAAVYRNFIDVSNTVVCYARLAYLPGRSSRTRVLLAGGPHAASTQAASLFLTRPGFLTSIRQRLGIAESGTLPWFEAVVEARAIGNEPWTARIASIRIFEGPTTASSQ